MSRPARALLLAALALVPAACGGARTTYGTSPESVATRKALWDANGFVSYSYDLSMSGFPWCAGPPIHVHVRGDSIVSATVIATGQPLGPSCMPHTIDGLFDSAIGSARNGGLTAIRYDARYGYPVQIDIEGPPDAAGSLYAANLQPEAIQ